MSNGNPWCCNIYSNYGLCCTLPFGMAILMLGVLKRTLFLAKDESLSMLNQSSVFENLLTVYCGISTEWEIYTSFTLITHPYFMKCNVHMLTASFYLVNASVWTRQVYIVQFYFNTIVTPGINLLASLSVHTLSHKKIVHLASLKVCSHTRNCSSGILKSHEELFISHHCSIFLLASQLHWEWFT